MLPCLPWFCTALSYRYTETSGGSLQVDMYSTHSAEN